MRKKKITIFDVINSVLMLCILIICVYPFYSLLVSSLSDPTKVEEWIFIFPKNISFGSYREIFGNQPDSATHVYFLHESLRGNDSDASLLQYVRLPGNAAGASFPERHV